MYRTVSNPGHSEPEVNNGVSMTVPDQSYSVRELLVKFTSGNFPMIERQSYYEDNPDFDTFHESELGDFDFSDYARELSDIEDRVVELKIKAKEKKKDVEPEKPPLEPPLEKSEEEA